MSQAPTTKCPFCGGTLTVYGDFCPHCGSKKEQFSEHRENMKAFQRSFESIKEGVVKENRKDSKRSASIAVIAVLVMLILATIIGLFNTYEISRMYKSRQIRKNLGYYQNALDELIESRDYIGINGFWHNNDLYLARNVKGIDKYNLYIYFDDYFVYFSQYLSFYLHPTYINDNSPEELHKYKENQITNMLECYQNFHKYYKTQILEYNPADKYSMYVPECYSEETIKAIDEMDALMDYMISYYFEIPLEEMENFKNLSPIKQSAMLADALERKEAANE